MIIRLLPTYIYLFMDATISLECTKVKLLISNNFATEHYVCWVSYELISRMEMFICLVLPPGEESKIPPWETQTIWASHKIRSWLEFWF